MGLETLGHISNQLIIALKTGFIATVNPLNHS